MVQLLLHLFGDYVLQTDKQALNKKKPGFFGFMQCFYHCLFYSLPFLLIGSWLAVLVIGVTHFIIDRSNLVVNLIAWKNKMKDKSNFGFALDRPFALSIWLMIIFDNTLHLIINYFALLYL